MATLRYHHTFIDEQSIGVLAPRSQSWPQLRGSGPGNATEEIEDVETQAAGYVAELEGKCSAAFGDYPKMPPEPETQTMTSHPPWSAQEAPEVPTAVQNVAVAAIAQPPAAASEGSRGHPLVCRRPCIRLAKGNCNMGDACGYCHHEHPRYVTPDKNQRLLLNHMDPWSLLHSFALFLFRPCTLKRSINA
eukprot:s7178_g1.t1